MHSIRSLIALLTLLAVPALGGEQALNVRAERDLYGFAAQQALSFGSARVTMSRNSNFACPAGPVAELGLFHADLSRNWKLSRRELEQIRLRVPAKLNAPELRPHATRYFVGTSDITTLRTAERAVDRTLGWTCDPREWIAEKGMRAEARMPAGAGAAVEVRFTELRGKSAKAGPWRKAETVCTAIDGAWDCLLPGFGKARLRLP